MGRQTGPRRRGSAGGFSMLTIFVHRNGETKELPAWDPTLKLAGCDSTASDAIVWADLAAPTPEEAAILDRVFGFHELAIEDAISESHHPKIEPYDGYLYLILHGIDFRVAEQQFGTHDTDFFLGPNYLVTVHDPAARTVPEVQAVIRRNGRILGEGAAALMHRIIDTMIDHYHPEVEKLEDRIDVLEKDVFNGAGGDIVRQLLDMKRDIGEMRRIVVPQRDAVGRLARREFPLIDNEVAYRYRDVYDHLVRLSDEALIFQDRVNGLLEAHVSNVSNRLNEVMKVLTVIATIFMPLTVLTGAYGMNIGLPKFPGGEGAQFWWVFGIMLALSGGMLLWFRKRRWI